MGRHRHSPSCAGTQPQDLGFSEGTARVSHVLTYTVFLNYFQALGRAAAASEQHIALFSDVSPIQILCGIL